MANTVPSSTNYTFYGRYLTPGDTEDADTFEFVDAGSGPVFNHYWVFYAATSNVEYTTDDSASQSLDSLLYDGDYVPPDPIIDDGIF